MSTTSSASSPAPSPKSDTARLLAEQEQSGQSIAAFARERGIAPWKLYAVRRRSRPRPQRRSTLFAPVRLITERAAVTAFQLELPAGMRLHVPPGFDADELARLLSALEAC